MTEMQEFNDEAEGQPKFLIELKLEDESVPIEIDSLEGADDIGEYTNIIEVKLNVIDSGKWVSKACKSKIRELADGNDDDNIVRGIALYDWLEREQTLSVGVKGGFIDTEDAINTAQALVGLCVLHNFIDEKVAQSIGWNGTCPVSNGSQKNDLETAPE